MNQSLSRYPGLAINLRPWLQEPSHPSYHLVQQLVPYFSVAEAALQRSPLSYFSAPWRLASSPTSANYSEFVPKLCLVVVGWNQRLYGEVVVVGDGGVL